MRNIAHCDRMLMTAFAMLFFVPPIIQKAVEVN